ncbi:2-oxoisovalerate dehydrogenase E1 component [Streptosporangium becharense]|uniref:2-oxoisovalerate dehydrogenase E1 component n=1 Tax=Streptosporangium becharense TaxID=1816182 RepID=A0A7W9ILN0_9ACTN|nr:thiamine pyrophosphate-dependent enzyme [Streptosporangium becharense]MBB2911547.1 2-oxoisovalerate dehydrogenase E1 component [Streptosporangium becharense]MBB5822635.1 2-oxoisovalerate dehydrogenase E1 component [Streptosporangium becharense]
MARDTVETHFTEAVTALSPGAPRDPSLPVREGTGLTGARCRELFEFQLGSRLLDVTARWLREQGQGFYTIGSAGHEGNAAIASVLRTTDPALLHYRSGAFYLTRSAMAGRLPEEGLRDVLLGLTAAAEEPIAGGRHKVFGHPDLAVIPQTSTIASHLPRAVGVAFAIERVRRLGVPGPWPADAVAVCSLGDASVNHASALTGFNTAAYGSHQGLALPILFVCEDNGLGISVRTPNGWVESSHHPLLCYFEADGCDLPDVYDTALAAVEHVRTHRAPVLLRVGTVRLMGHAGSDVESSYRTRREINADLERDPLVATARLLVEAGLTTPDEVLLRYETTREHLFKMALESSRRPRLVSAVDIMEPLAPRRPEAVAVSAAVVSGSRARVFAERLPEQEGPLTLSQAVNRTLADALAAHPDMLVFGEDVARKGGVYGVTRGLQKRFGLSRVFDTHLDEQAVLGLALGAGVSGLLPVPEIQYLAYLHNALDQIRGEGATLSFFSRGAFRNPMVVRVASYAYQKGFGGHFHNDNSVAALRDIPGLVVASPARPDDAASMLRTCLAAARADGSVCVFLEPIALYNTRDMFEDGDNGWLAPYVPPARWAETHVPIGRARSYGDGRDLTIVTFGNGLRMSLRAAVRLTAEGHSCRVLDLRWLSPLPVDDLLRAAELTGNVLIADETRRTGGVSEGIVAELLDAGFTGRVARVTSADSFIPLGDAAKHVLLSEAEIEAAARKLLG